MKEYSYFENTIESIDVNTLIRHEHNTSKADFGVVGVIGGQDGMMGSLFLVGRAAMLTGSGKVILGFKSNNYPPVDYVMPELMIGNVDKILDNLDKYDVLVVGPGLGMGKKSIEIVTDLIDIKPKCKIIFDADALNIISANKKLAKTFSTLQDKIITPHQAEAARLLKTSIDSVNNNRINSALELQKKYNGIVLLKGHGSVIAYNNSKVYVNKTGSSALSNAGQGDSLSGVIASFIAQGLDLLNALRLAVYLQGAASDDLVKTYGGYNGIIATDTAISIRKILNKILYSR